MSTTNIQLLRSNVLSKRPAASVLLDGQVAVNYHYQEPGLYFRLTNGKLTKVGPVAYSNDGSVPNAVPAGQPGNLTGEEWLDGRVSYDSPVLKVFDGTNWVTSSGFTINDATGDLAIDRDITCNILHADTLDLTDALVLKNDLLSSGDCLHSIGAELARFQYAWLCYADIKHNLKVGEQINGNDLTLTGDIIARHLTTNGNNVLGAGVAFTTKVDSQATFEYDVAVKGSVVADVNVTTGSLQVLGNTILGTDCLQTLTVKSASTFDCAVTFNDTVNFSGSGLTDTFLKGNTIIGDGCGTSTLTIEAATTVKCDILPETDKVVNLGSATKRFDNIYTGDLHLKNERGDWTMVEEDEFLTLRNNKTGKTFRLLMEEV